MAVYVDNLRIPWRGKEWCHLLADSLDELHSFAEKLGLNERVLHRNLKKENCTYESLVESARLSSVERLLRENQLPMSQISGLLGYSEQSSFNRAFKRWFGVSPKHYLRELNDNSL